MVATRKCAPGRFYRKSYTRKGTRVAGRCIRKTTRGIPSRHYAAATRRKMGIRMRGFKKSARAVRGCPKGTILRAPYVRYTKRGTHVRVPAACIPDVGAPGKGLRSTKRNRPGIGPLKQGNLTRYGYAKIAGMSQDARRTALRKAVAAYGSLTVWRKLNALSVYTRRTSPDTSKKAKADMDWIKATWGLKAF
jgi:hypothetical protein